MSLSRLELSAPEAATLSDKHGSDASQSVISSVLALLRSSFIASFATFISSRPDIQSLIADSALSFYPNFP
jgi:hypothetical protein